ncbi:MAG: sugar phosphate isomerase/epimerase family protein [Gaiellales bacterium]
MAQLELGMISSTWLDTKVGRLEGIRRAKEIGFDTYDVFEDALDLTDAERREIRAACDEAGLPVRSQLCVAFGAVDFNPSVRRFTLDRLKANIDQGAFLGARNLVVVIGEYYWDSEVFPGDAIWGLAVEMVREAGFHAAKRGLEVVVELEPFEQSLAKDVHELVRFVRDVDHPAVRANADISHLHLSGASFDEVAELTGLIGHIHLSDCDGKVHGDLPAGRGVTPIREYLQAIVDTGYEGTVSIELEYSPDPDRIVEWVAEAYEATAAIMREVGVRGGG